MATAKFCIEVRRIGKFWAFVVRNNCLPQEPFLSISGVFSQPKWPGTQLQVWLFLGCPLQLGFARFAWQVDLFLSGLCSPGFHSGPAAIATISHFIGSIPVDPDISVTRGIWSAHARWSVACSIYYEYLSSGGSAPTSFLILMDGSEQVMKRLIGLHHGHLIDYRLTRKGMLSPSLKPRFA